MESFSLRLPFPPTINHYYWHNGSSKVITDTGRLFRAAVKRAFKSQSGYKMPGRVALNAVVDQPSHDARGRKDGRRRDLDNLEKALWDSLKGLAYDDDSQIYYKAIGWNLGLAPARAPVRCPGGGVTVEIVAMPEPSL